MKDVAKRLQEIGPTISKICELSGAAGASIGVLHQNQVIHTAGFGFRDVAAKLAPDANTQYHIASLSKAFTGAAVSLLVHEKRVDWNDPISQLLPDFHHYDPTIKNDATLLDFLSHRTCLAQKSALWLQDGTQLLLGPKELLPTISYAELVHPLRSEWLYSNWGYCIAAEILERLTGKSWADFLAERVFAPLGLKRTSTERYPKGDNIAKSYQAFPDGTPSPVEPPALVAGSIMQGAAGVISSVSDLLIFYQALLKAWKDQAANNTTATPGLPLMDVRMSLTGHIPLEIGSSFEQFYGIGWAVSELPAPLGQIGTNGMFIPKMPVVGKGSKKRSVWHHNGSLVGFFSSVHILPDSDTAIIVLTNSLANNDCADWIGQLLLETVLDNSDKNDYVKLATESVAVYRSMWSELGPELDKARVPNTTAQPVKAYTGKYYNAIRNWFVEIEAVDNCLEFKFQGLSNQTHKLSHYHYDTFSWLLTAHESIERGRWPDLTASVYLFEFGAGRHGDITTLKWVHDWAVPAGEIFSSLPVQVGAEDQSVLGKKHYG
ncbi:hypothetical protein MMC30_003431 [Trapelia coarctata]|nr:hypothetical protein [Trapelia coarctata]